MMSVVAFAMTVSLKELKEMPLLIPPRFLSSHRQELHSVLPALDILFQSQRQRNHKPQIKSAVV